MDATFRKINNITAWAVFGIALLVYWLTMEETASFWDCGEFIAVSYKLMVPHPPGAPLFLLTGRMFSFLAFGDVEKVSYAINLLSVFASSFTILFLFWTIVLLAIKFVKPGKSGNYCSGQTFSLMAAGAIGALAYTFSDSFWFSAVEAEVYGMSSFFTAFVFWAMLKWEHIRDEDASNRWLILITYMMGLSIGVHLLNLVTIPALGLIYYFKKYPRITPKGLIAALLIGGAIILIIMYGIIPGLPSLAGDFEIFFVNTLGLFFGSGVIFFILLFVGILVYAIIYTQKKQMVLLNTALLGVAFILIGYASYGLVVVRSNFNPPIDENNPENIVSFVSYLKREQYGNRPLIYGNLFTASRTGIEKGAGIYRKRGKKYEIYDYKTTATYNDNIFLPRIYSQQPGHPELYRRWIGLKQGEKPTFRDNIYYMLKYQFGHMYFRYFLWNFAGRAGDDKESGWLSPFAHTEHLPEALANNKARNNFYMLPLILGLIGAFFHFRRDKPIFWTVMLLFFLTGLGLVLYLNSPPTEPRERDYIYVGSFYAFCIWIGFGVLAIAEALEKVFKRKIVAAAVSTLICVVVPGIMAAKGWKSHNRSNRYHSVDQAKNTLSSCAPNAILFTGGDNDTFPLWYVQDVEGFRTDVRVIVLSYFSTDWYIGQMRRKVYKSDPIPLSISEENYLQGKNDYIPLIEQTDRPLNARTYIRLVNQDNPQVRVPLQGGDSTAMLPSKQFYLDIDREKVRQMSFIPEKKKDRVVSRMQWQLSEGANHFFKNELALLDLIVSNNWERPIYFNNTSANTINMDLREYLQLEGMAYRLMPIKTRNSTDIGEVNIEVMQENLKKFAFRGFEDPNTYHDEEYRKFGVNARHAYYRLADALYQKGKGKEAEQTLDEGLQKIPDFSIPYSFFMVGYAELYHKMGQHEKAQKIVEVLEKRATQNIEYLLATNQSNYQLKQRSLIILQQIALTYRRLERLMQMRIDGYENKRLLNQTETDSIRIEDEKLITNIKRTKENQELFLSLTEKYNTKFSEILKKLEKRLK